MRLRVARPATLVDIGRLSDLSYVREDGDTIAIGALTRHHDVADVRGAAGVMPDRRVHGRPRSATPQVRHMGTIGGSVAHGDPAGDMPSVLLALDADVRGAGPERGADDRARATSSCRCSRRRSPHDEVLTEIRVPKATAGWAYLKFNRRAQDWALVGRRGGPDRTAARSVGLTNMGLTPLRAIGVEEALDGGADPATGRGAGRRGHGAAGRTRSGRPSTARDLVKVLVRRALEEAMA